MTNKYRKGCSMSYGIRELQIKTMGYHHALIRMAEMQHTDLTKCREDAEHQQLPFITGASATS